VDGGKVQSCFSESSPHPDEQCGSHVVVLHDSFLSGLCHAMHDKFSGGYEGIEQH